MAAINGCKFLGIDYTLCSAPDTHVKVKPTTSLLCPLFSGPNFGSRSKAFAFPSTFRISYRRNKALEQCLRTPSISCLSEDNYEGHPKTEQPPQQDAAIEVKLPRRSLLVTFTCDACGARSQRLINRLAFERGLVYVQCSGCSQYHKLVDNLGLVIEYNLQEEIEMDAGADQV